MDRKILLSLSEEPSIHPNTAISQVAKTLHPQSTESRPWADLKMRILESFLEKLSLQDHIRFGAVCKPWSSASTIKPNKELLWPWLVLPEHPSHGTLSLYSPMEPKSYDLKLSLLSPFDCFGHSRGWLIMYDETQGYYLHNPLNKQMLKLPYPDEPDTDLDGHYNFFRNAILCCGPNKVVVAAQAVACGLYFCMPGDEKWVLLAKDFYGTFTCRNGYLYCVDLLKSIITCYKMDPEPRLLWERTVELPENCSIYGTYLVESSSGDLILLKKEDDFVTVVHGLEDKALCIAKEFYVYKLDYVSTKWVPIKSLPNNDILFVSSRGESCAFSASANPLGYKPNCIYFTDAQSGCLLDDDYYGPVQYCDQGVFSLDDGVVKQWAFPDHYCPRIMPFWFYPKVGQC